MAFQENQQIVADLFASWGLPGWGGNVHPPNQDQLLLQLSQARLNFENLHFQMVHDPQVGTWLNAVQAMTQNAQPHLNDWYLLRWLCRGHRHYIRYRVPIDNYFRSMRTAMSQLGAFLSQPEEENRRVQAINDIIESLRLHRELLRPIGDFVAIRFQYRDKFDEADPAFDEDRDWAKENLGLQEFFRGMQSLRQTLEEFFIEESLRGWGDPLPILPIREVVARLESIFFSTDSIELIQTELINNEIYLQWRAVVQNVDNNPAELQNQAQFIAQGYWMFYPQFQALRHEWDQLLIRLEDVGPYISSPEDSMEKRQLMTNAVYGIGLIEELLSTFTTAQSLLPQLLAQQRGYGPDTPHAPEEHGIVLPLHHPHDIVDE